MKYITRTLPVILMCGAMLGVSGCKKGATVQRVDTASTTDLSGAWNDTDSRLVAKEMIQDVLSRPWLRKFTKRTKGGTPAVIIGRVRNLSHEHINTRTFVNDMEKALINSGEVDFVASSSERREIRAERKDMDVHASDASRKEAGQEQGADFMLKGDINTIIDAVAGKHVRFYQVDLTLIDLKNNRKVWVGQKKIKKTVARDSFRL